MPVGKGPLPVIPLFPAPAPPGKGAGRTVWQNAYGRVWDFSPEVADPRGPDLRKKRGSVSPADSGQGCPRPCASQRSSPC